MTYADLKLFAKRPPVVIAGLLVIAVLTFLGVNRLVTRFREQQKALARHLFEHGEAVATGNPEQAIEYFRAALIYWPNNFQGQLALARVLRDTDRTAEAETYLRELWENSPQDGAVNLALARLYAREKVVDRATQYYHNAIYGEWASNVEIRRRDARFELVNFLLRQNVFVPAQAELLSLAAVLPRETPLQLQVAQLFLTAQDYNHAFDQFRDVLQTDRANPEALAGAGKAAFQLGRFDTAQSYLQDAVRAKTNDSDAVGLLNISNLVLKADPNLRHISQTERNRRVQAAFSQAGERLSLCASSKEIDLNSPLPASKLTLLNTRWLALKPKMVRLRREYDSDLSDQVMDLVFDIEQQTADLCGTPGAGDQALLLLHSQDHVGAQQ